MEQGDVLDSVGREVGMRKKAAHRGKRNIMTAQQGIVKRGNTEKLQAGGGGMAESLNR